MSELRVHLARDEDHSGGFGVTTCGDLVPSARLTGAHDAITCKRCQRLHEKRKHGDMRPVSWDEAIREVLHVLAGPRVEAYPPLTPEVWRTMRCREGRECHCEFCLIDAANVAPRAQWDAEQALRPHRRHEHPFGSVAAALELLVRGGSSVRSSQGSLQARCTETARLGTQVQTTRRHDREDLVIRRVTYAVDVERAVRRAYAEASERRGLSVEQCTGLLLASVDTDAPSVEEWAERLGVSVAIVKAVVRHGRRVVTVELAASGYVPWPRRRTGLWPAIEKRRAEIGEEAA